MSYSAIIQKDSPAITWNLDEDPSITSTISPDKFLYKSNNQDFYEGTYLSAEKIGFPIVYGGKSSVKVNNGGYIKIPSLNKMSQKDMGNSSSLEFWVKVNTSYSSEQIMVKKYDVDNDGSPDYATCIYLKNDYFTFRLGTTDKYYEVSAPVDSVNKPIHIVASYTPSSISISVNGVKKIKEITNIQSLFPTYDSADEYFWFVKPSDISNIQFDCIALYSYDLPRERVIKHFVYGCGYNVPSTFVRSNGGVFYNFSMEGHKPIKTHKMGNGKPWSLSSLSDALATPSGLYTKTYPSPYVASTVKITQDQIDSHFVSSNSFTFDKDTYLEIKDASTIIQNGYGGWLLKFNLSGVTITANKQTLFYIYSNTSPDYIECYLIVDSGNKIVFDINGTLTKNSITVADNYYAGVYIDKNNSANSNIYYGTSPNTQNKTYLNDLVINDYNLRIGSTLAWQDNSDENNLPDNSFCTGKLKEIKALNTTTLANNKKYISTPSYTQKRFITSTVGSAIIDVPLQTLCPAGTYETGYSRIEFGSPFGASSCSISASGKHYVGSTETTFLSSTAITNRVVTSGSWINLVDVSGHDVDILSFAVSLETDDMLDKPAKLSYFNLNAYAENDGYLLCNSSLGGNPLKIYSTANISLNIPEISETPFFYNGYSSGFSLKENYATITHDLASAEDDGVDVISFMLYVPSGLSSATYDILSIDGSNYFKITQTGTVNSSGLTCYINGLEYNSSSNKIKLDQWQLVVLVFNSEQTTPTLTLGKTTSQTASIFIDQLMIFAKPYKSNNSYQSFITNLYTLFVGGINETRTDDTTEIHQLKIDDSGTVKDGDIFTASYDSIVYPTYIVSEENSTIWGDLPKTPVLVGGIEIETVPITYLQTYSLDDYFFGRSIKAVTNGTTIEISGYGSWLSNKNLYYGASKTNTPITITSVVVNTLLQKTTVTLSSPVTVTANQLLYFSNYEKTQNIINYNKTLINGQVMQPNSTMLIYAPSVNKYYHYKINTVYNVNNTNTKSSGYITFTKIPLVANAVYEITSYQQTRDFKWNSTAQVLEEMILRKKIKFNNPPEPVIDEDTE